MIFFFSLHLSILMESRDVALKTMGLVSASLWLYLLCFNNVRHDYVTFSPLLKLLILASCEPEQLSN